MGAHGRGLPRPKILEDIEDQIFNGKAVDPDPTDPFHAYIYRQTFHLSAEAFADEPLDQFFINMKILAMINARNKNIAKFEEFNG